MPRVLLKGGMAMDGLVALLLSGAGLFKCVFVESCVLSLGPPPSHLVRTVTAKNDTANTGKTNLFLFINVDFDKLTKKLCHPESITGECRPL
jgi:hypothetical protein